MDAFATIDDMRDRSQGAITADSHPFLVQELEAASRAIRNECRWHVAGAEALTYTRRGPYPDAIWLPAMRITAITAATVDDTVLDPAEIDFDPDTGWTDVYGRRVVIEFTAGFTPIPEDLVALTLELAAGALGSPLGLSREQAGAVSVTYSRTTGELTTADRDRLAAYRLGRLP